MKWLSILQFAIVLLAVNAQGLATEEAVDSTEDASATVLSCDLPVHTSCNSALSSSAGAIMSFNWNGSQLEWHTPSKEAPAPLAQYIAVGGHYVAIDQAGMLWTWGRNDSDGGGQYGSPPMLNSGQLGWPRRSADASTPGSVVTSSRFIAAAAGRYHSAALDEEGRLFTWGLNDFGQLGRDAMSTEHLSTEHLNVEGLHQQDVGCTGGWSCHDARVLVVSNAPERFVAVAAGRYHTTVVSESGKVYTTGLNLCGSKVCSKSLSARVLPFLVWVRSKSLCEVNSMCASAEVS